MDIPTFAELFKLIKFNLFLFGIPLNESKIPFRFYFFLFNLIVMIMEEGGFLIVKYSPENLLQITQLAPYTCVGILSLLKMICIFYKRQKISQLMQSLDELYSEILMKQSAVNLIKGKTVTVQSFLKYFFILNLVLVFVTNFSSIAIMAYTYLTTNTVVFPIAFAIVIPFTVDTWPKWCLIFCQELTCATICVNYFTTVDALYCMLTLHICNNFTVLADEIERLDETNTHTLPDLVKKHQNILKLSEDLEDIFSLPNFFNVLVGSVEICALGFNISVGDLTQIPACLLFLMSVLLQILIMSVFGEDLIQKSRKVSEAVFCSKWYNMDEKSKKTLLIIMRRSQKFQILTAYKFSVICYESFTTIISTSWSYFTILRTAYKPTGNHIE